MMDGIQILSGLGDGRKTRFAPGTAPLVETGTACYVILQGPEGPLYDFEGPLEDRDAAERRRRDIADGAESILNMSGAAAAIAYLEEAQKALHPNDPPGEQPGEQPGPCVMKR